MEASAQFEEDLQTLQASIDAEYGKDSDGSGKKFFLSTLVTNCTCVCVCVCVCV